MTSSDTMGIPESWLKEFQSNFDASEKNKLAQNVCTQHSLLEVCASRAIHQTSQHRYSHKIDGEGKPMTDQKSSGRCWIFACHNIMRQPFMKKYGLESFEFSHTYLFFWDKVERANYLLNAFVECARKGETYEGRLISHLLKSPSEDGGQWDMLVNLVEKYGVVPKASYPEAWSAENSLRLGRLLNNRLREDCMVLHKMVSEGKSDKEIDGEKRRMLEEVHRIMCIVLGTPPTSVTFQYYSKSEGTNGGNPQHKVIGPISPRDFYHTLIKPDCLDMEDMVCLVNDPRPQHPYNKLYTVEYLGNMTEGRPVLYINQPVEVLKQLTLKSIADDNKPVWFGCDVGKYFRGKEGYLDLKCLDFTLVFGVDPLQMDKAERLMYGESLMTHAMTFTGVNISGGEGDNRAADKWRVENSWGEDRGDKGYLCMTDAWFSEFVYEVVVSKKHLSPDILAVLDQTPVVLPAWDPMGALAH